MTGSQQWFGEASYPIDLNGDGLLDIISADLMPGPDGIYGTEDEYDEIFPIMGIRDYPKVSNISVLSDEELVDGLDLTFVPDLGITHFYIEKIHGGDLFDSNQQAVGTESFVERSVAESGFLFTPQLDFQGNAFFYIQGSTAASQADLVGSKFITKIEVTCGGSEAPTVTDNYAYCDGDEILPINIDSSEYNFVWYSNADLTEILAEGNSFQPENIIGTTTYFVTQKLEICESDPSLVSVTIYEKPQIEIDATSTSICEGESVTLSGIGGLQYEWNNDVSDGVPFQHQETTTYELIGYDSNNCSNTASITIEVNDVPGKPEITRLEDPLIKLISNSSKGNQWFLNGTNIEGATEVEYYPTEVGNYTVQVMLNECTSEFSDEIEVLGIILSIDEKKDHLVLWPNPVTKTLNFQDSHRKFSEYIIYTQTGIVLLSGKLTSSVDVSALTKGIYLIKIFDRSNSKVLKIIKN